MVRRPGQLQLQGLTLGVDTLRQGRELNSEALVTYFWAFELWSFGDMHNLKVQLRSYSQWAECRWSGQCRGYK